MMQESPIDALQNVRVDRLKHMNTGSLKHSRASSHLPVLVGWVREPSSNSQTHKVQRFFTCLDAALQVEAGLRQIGRNATASPYWVHSAMAAVVGSLPDWLMNAYLLSAHKSLRARWYKKQARGKQE